MQEESVVIGSMPIMEPKPQMAQVVLILTSQVDHLDLVSLLAPVAQGAQKAQVKLASTGKVLTILTAQEV